MTEIIKDSSNNPETPAAHHVGPTTHTLRKRRMAIVILTSIFLIVGVLWLAYWLIWGRFAVETDDAYVNGNMVRLMSQIPGTVIEISADDTQLVNAGQVIIRLDPANMEIALQRAQAVLAQTVRQVRQDFENAKRAEESVILRNADLMRAQQDVKRRTGLVGEKAVSRESYQHYETQMTVAKARYELALYTLKAAQALVENSHLYTHPLVERAKANLKSAYLNRQRTVIVAPVTGYVAKRNVQVGEQVMLNTHLLTIVPLNEIWVDANYKESQLSNIRINQPVTLSADAYSDVKFHGRVFGLSAGTGAVFSLLPPQNATGNWIKIVQRLPVRIALDPKELKKYPLQLGLSMRVTTDIHNINGDRLAVKSQAKPVYVTTVYEKQLADANKLIDNILINNAPDMYLPQVPA